MSRKAAILVLVIVLSLAGYGYTYIQVSSAIQALEIDVADFRIEGFSIFPPSADGVFVFMSVNPSGYDLELRVDADMYCGDTLITPIEVSDTIRANGRSTFDVPVHITSSVIGVLTETSAPQFTVEGEVTFTYRIFGVVPVVFTRTGSF